MVTGADVDMKVQGIGDHTLVAVERAWGAGATLEGPLSWTSRDGQAWTPLTDYPADWHSVVPVWDRGLIYVPRTSQTDAMLSVIDGGLSLVQLSQIGALPWSGNTQLLVGPTGLLATDDGSRFWIGVPTAR